MTSGEPQPSPADLMREQRLQRNLKIVVIGLGLLTLIGLAAVIVRIVGLASGKGNTEALKTIISAPGGTLALELPRGAKVVSVSLSGNRLAVHHEGPDGTGIAIVDLETGKRVLDVHAIPAVPRN